MIVTVELPALPGVAVRALLLRPRRLARVENLVLVADGRFANYRCYEIPYGARWPSNSSRS
ncbi:MAG: hypothetical protein U1F09_16530 [Steroidobacteraceae bacterium]